jgi:hypothetical protein
MPSVIFVNCLILIEYIFVFVAQMFSLFIFGRIFIRLFFKKVKSTIEVSPSMTLYVSFQIITSISTIIYMIFLIIGWRPFSTIYNACIMYFMGAIQSHFFTFLPAAVLALGIDRCLCVFYPMRYSKEKYYLPVYFAFFLMTLLTALAIIYRIIPAFPSTLITNCYSFGCQTTTLGGQIYFYMRYFTGACIIALSIILFIIIRIKLKSYFSSNSEGRVSQATV